jgi:hypothetical protein
MLAEYKTKTNIGVGLGILGQLLGRMLIVRGGETGSRLFAILGFVLILAGFISFISGCCAYSVGKGYSSSYGFLGLLSCFGLFVLVLLRDKFPEGKPLVSASPPGPGAEPPNSGATPPLPPGAG